MQDDRQRKSALRLVERHANHASDFSVDACVAAIERLIVDTVVREQRRAVGSDIAPGLLARLVYATRDLTRLPLGQLSDAYVRASVNDVGGDIARYLSRLIDRGERASFIDTFREVLGLNIERHAARLDRLRKYEPETFSLLIEGRMAAACGAVTRGGFGDLPHGVCRDIIETQALLLCCNVAQILVAYAHVADQNPAPPHSSGLNKPYYVGRQLRVLERYALAIRELHDTGWLKHDAELFAWAFERVGWFKVPRCSVEVLERALQIVSYRIRVRAEAVIASVTDVVTYRRADVAKLSHLKLWTAMSSTEWAAITALTLRDAKDTVRCHFEERMRGGDAKFVRPITSTSGKRARGHQIEAMRLLIELRRHMLRDKHSRPNPTRAAEKAEEQAGVGLMRRARRLLTQRQTRLNAEAAIVEPARWFVA